MRRRRALASVTILCGLAALATAPGAAAIGRHRLHDRLAAALHSGGGQHGAWVTDLDAGKAVLFSHGARTARVLASNTKLFTTSAVLHRFGPDRRLATGVWVDGQRAGRRRIDGDLALVGVGDPLLASAGFASAHGLPLTPLGSLASQIKRAGIHVVKGHIVADDTVFDHQRGVPQTGITPEPIPPLSGLEYDSGMSNGHFAGDPALVAGRALKRSLHALGVRVTGRVRVADTPNSLRDRSPIAKVRSPRLSRIITATNRPSNNFFAELLLKRLAAHPDGGGTTARGARLAERFAHSVGSGVVMENGSGLSRRDQATPHQVGRLLVAMSTRDGGALRKTLSVAGRNGTLVNRMKGTAAAGNCWAKTGTLSDVSALSGYCRSRGGHMIAFSVLFNGVDVSGAQDAEDRFAEAIAAYG